MSNIIYMIDRNIIGKIKDNFKDLKPEKITRIKSLDRKGVTISLLFAMIEGSKGSPQTTSEAFDGIKKKSNIFLIFLKMLESILIFSNMKRFLAQQQLLTSNLATLRGTHR